MAYPAGMTVATLTAGSDLSFAGDPAALTVEIEVLLGGSNHLVWAATGQPLDAFLETYSGSAGSPVSFQLPHVDQAGFKNSNGDNVTGWSYKAKITARKGGETKTRTKNFQLLVGQTLVDLDLIPDGSVSVPVVAPVLPVTSLAGLTGPVTAEQLVAVLDAELDAREDAKGSLAYAENRTGDFTYSTGPGAPIPGCVISVPPTDKDVWIEWGANAAVAIGGEGVVNTTVYEITSGGAAVVGTLVPAKYESNAIASAQGPSHAGRTKVGPSTIARVFALYLSHYSATGSGLVGYVANGDTDYSRSYITAEAR